MEELERCPFCGSEADVHEYCVKCMECRAFVEGRNKEEAIKAWNRRHSEPTKEASGKLVFGAGDISVVPATQDGKHVLVFEPNKGTGIVNEVVPDRKKGMEVSVKDLNKGVMFEFQNTESVDVVLKALFKLREQIDEQRRSQYDN